MDKMALLPAVLPVLGALRLGKWEVWPVFRRLPALLRRKTKAMTKSQALSLAATKKSSKPLS